MPQGQKNIYFIQKTCYIDSYVHLPSVIRLNVVYVESLNGRVKVKVILTSWIDLLRLFRIKHIKKERQTQYLMLSYTKKKEFGWIKCCNLKDSHIACELNLCNIWGIYNITRATFLPHLEKQRWALRISLTSWHRYQGCEQRLQGGEFEHGTESHFLRGRFYSGSSSEFLSYCL